MDFSQRSLTRSYSQEDIREILNIALANHSTLDTELSYSQLLEIAQELSISPDSIELAKSQWIDLHIVRGVAAWRVFYQRQGYGYNRAFQKWEYQQKM